MDIEKIRALKLAHPFVPFNLVHKDGRRLPVDRSSYLALSPTKRFVVHSSIGGGFETLPVDVIRDIDFEHPEKLRVGLVKKGKQ